MFEEKNEEDHKSDGGDTISSMSDTFTNIEDDDPSLYFSLFNRNVFKKPTMDEIMEKCLLRREMSVVKIGRAHV